MEEKVKNDKQMPAIHPVVFYTKGGTHYLQSPGVALIAATSTDLSGVQGYLDGHNPLVDFRDYLKDPTELDDGAQLVKFAGQLCYQSFSQNRTMNANIGKYLDNLKSSGHGSVLEHATLSFFVYGIDRSVTHEIVRHRTGFAFSQVSQRYVSGSVLRFVERPEYRNDPVLHERFEQWIDLCRTEYETRAALISKRVEGIGSSIARHQIRKQIYQAARAALPNETEAPIVITGNIRAWRHFFEMRGAWAAEVTIRKLAHTCFLLAKGWEPEFFSDYQEDRPTDEDVGLSTKWRKV